MKIVCILTGGFILFRDPISFEQFLGMCMSIIGFYRELIINQKFLIIFLISIKGVILYSVFTMRNNAKKPVEKPSLLLPLSTNDTKN